MKNKEDVLALLRKNKPELSRFGVSSIGLFGSYLHDKQTNESDIDLLIDFEPEQETFDNYMAVYDIFENLFTDKKVEIVTKNGLSKHIGPAILKGILYA